MRVWIHIKTRVAHEIGKPGHVERVDTRMKDGKWRKREQFVWSGSVGKLKRIRGRQLMSNKFAFSKLQHVSNLDHTAIVPIMTINKKS